MHPQWQIGIHFGNYMLQSDGSSSSTWLPNDYEHACFEAEGENSCWGVKMVLLLNSSSVDSSEFEKRRGTNEWRRDIAICSQGDVSEWTNVYKKFVFYGDHVLYSTPFMILVEVSWSLLPCRWPKSRPRVDRHPLSHVCAGFSSPTEPTHAAQAIRSAYGWELLDFW